MISSKGLVILKNRTACTDNFVAHDKRQLTKKKLEATMMNS